MSLPSPTLIRSRIEQITPPEVKMAYKATYLFDARIGEIIAYKYPSDKTAHPTGLNLKVRTETFQVNMNRKEEVNNAFTTLMNTLRRTPTLNQIMKIKEPCAVFTVTTEKRRGGWTREIGLPLNPKYVDGEWTQQLLTYFNTHKKDTALFPFKRQQIYPIAKKAFTGLQVHIKPYEKAVRKNGEYEYTTEKNGKQKLLTETVKAHNKQFSQHSLRKIRRTELEQVFGFTKEERKYYGGWSLGIEERYGEGDWRKSFPKLLQPKGDK